jgi:hypothetical protein
MLTRRRWMLDSIATTIYGSCQAATAVPIRNVRRESARCEALSARARPDLR